VPENRQQHQPKDPHSVSGSKAENAEKVEVGVILGVTQGLKMYEKATAYLTRTTTDSRLFRSQQITSCQRPSARSHSTNSSLTALSHQLLQGNTVMERREETKDAIDYVEDSASRKQAFGDDEMPLPLLLEGLGADELKKIGRRATWKLDLIIMPAMTMSATASTTARIHRDLTDILQKLYPQLP
jgi:hypothetical protein